jgi:hypothetical protein
MHALFDHAHHPQRTTCVLLPYAECAAESDILENVAWYSVQTFNDVVDARELTS